MKFKVFGNGMPADTSFYKGIPTNTGWDNSEFGTFAEAVTYANKWLGKWAPTNCRINYIWQAGVSYQYQYDDHVVICRIS